MPTLYGYEAVDFDLSAYTKPILLVGEDGMGKRTWIEQNLPENKLCVKTQSTKDELLAVRDMLSPGASFVWVLEITSKQNINYLHSIIKAVSLDVVVLAYTAQSLPDSLLALFSIHYIPYLTDAQMQSVCKEQNLLDDEAAFAVAASGGVPGKIHHSFELLRSRQFILEFMENVRDNNFKDLTNMRESVTDTDRELLQAILTSFETDHWNLFTRAEVEPLERVTGLLRACLETYSKADFKLAYTALYVGALHAYHGRV